jgi:hypothetical protein
LDLETEGRLGFRRQAVSSEQNNRRKFGKERSQHYLAKELSLVDRMKRVLKKYELKF